MQKLKWGVIGAGGIASRRTLPEFKQMVSNAEIVSVMDASGQTAMEVARRFEVPHYCDNEAELLARDVDVVYIATPHNFHGPQSIRAAEAGKHILCEKPMAVSIEEADRMAAAVKAAGVKFMLGYCMRNNVYNRKARDLVQAGALGQLVSSRAQLTCWYPPIPGAWRQDAAISHGGALLDMGTHCLDLLEWIMDAQVTEVTGFQDLMTHCYPTRIEDASTIVVRFSNGAHGIVDNYYNLPDAAAQNTLELHGTKGSIVAQGSIGQDPTGRMFSILQEEETGYDAGQVRNVAPSREEYHIQGIGLYGQMIDLFTRAILTHTEPPVTIEDGRHSVRVVEAIYQSIRDKRVVPVTAN